MIDYDNLFYELLELFGQSLDKELSFAVVIIVTQWFLNKN